MPSAAAANATAWAWLPALIAITPPRFSSAESELILFSAPRDLNDPVRWKSSHLSRAPSVRLDCSGVRGSALADRLAGALHVVAGRNHRPNRTPGSCE